MVVVWSTLGVGVGRAMTGTLGGVDTGTVGVTSNCGGAESVNGSLTPSVTCGRCTVPLRDEEVC